MVSRACSCSDNSNIPSYRATQTGTCTHGICLAVTFSDIFSIPIPLFDPAVPWPCPLVPALAPAAWGVSCTPAPHVEGALVVVGHEELWPAVAIHVERRRRSDGPLRARVDRLVVVPGLGARARARGRADARERSCAASSWRRSGGRTSNRGWHSSVARAAPPARHRPSRRRSSPSTASPRARLEATLGRRCLAHPDPVWAATTTWATSRARGRA